MAQLLCVLHDHRHTHDVIRSITPPNLAWNPCPWHFAIMQELGGQDKTPLEKVALCIVNSCRSPNSSMSSGCDPDVHSCYYSVESHGTLCKIQRLMVLGIGTRGIVQWCLLYSAKDGGCQPPVPRDILDIHQDRHYPGSMRCCSIEIEA
jgi:hypothetical protein